MVIGRSQGKLHYQDHISRTQISNLKIKLKMDAYNPMSIPYSYKSVGSLDIDSDVPNQQSSEFFDNFFVFDDWLNYEDQASIVPEYPDYTPVYSSPAIEDHGSQSNESGISHIQGNNNGATGIPQARKATKEKVAFKTKSQVEILDDGFKWRKYGKKMVKNSPNPRNYYRCSAEGCSVKKRVERDVEDARYVITTYEGVHNHQRPCNF